MVISRCLKENFVPLEKISGSSWRIRFSAYPETAPVLDSEGNPTGETKETGWLIYTAEVVFSEPTPEIVRKVRMEELAKYDNSDAVNAFFYNGKKMWFDKLTRTSISHSIEVEKSSGKETTELYDNDGVKYILPVDEALSLFDQVELYAKDCYNQTAYHKVQLAALDDVDALLAYDIKAGYPEKLHFGVSE